MIDGSNTLAGVPPHAVSQGPPVTTTERVQRIESLVKRIAAHVQAICQVNSKNGTSAETADKAVLACYEQINAFERRLALIQDGLKTA